MTVTKANGSTRNHRPISLRNTDIKTPIKNWINSKAVKSSGNLYQECLNLQHRSYQ